MAIVVAKYHPHVTRPDLSPPEDVTIIQSFPASCRRAWLTLLLKWAGVGGEWGRGGGRRRVGKVGLGEGGEDGVGGGGGADAWLRPDPLPLPNKGRRGERGGGAGEGQVT